MGDHDQSIYPPGIRPAILGSRKEHFEFGPPDLDEPLGRNAQTRHTRGRAQERDDSLRIYTERLRNEDIIALIVDSLRSGDYSPTPFYDPPGSTFANRGIRRRAYTEEYLRRPQVQRGLQELFERRCRYLALSTPPRWQSLSWLLQYPARIANPPESAVQQIRSTIQSVSEPVSVGDHTGWDEVQTYDDNVRAAAAAQRRAYPEILVQYRRVLDDAVQSLIENDNALSDLGEGGGAHTNEVITDDWASGITRYLVATSYLRHGLEGTTHMQEQAPHSPQIARRWDSRMSDAAVNAWRQLNNEQKSILQQDKWWEKLISDLWPVMRRWMERGARGLGQESYISIHHLRPPYSQFHAFETR